jgi:hypothetical protein
MSDNIDMKQTKDGKWEATTRNRSMVFDDYAIAGAWADAVSYGYQPDKCIFGGGSCGYPIEDCKNCPCHPGNSDPYWGMTKAVILSG